MHSRKSLWTHTLFSALALLLLLQGTAEATRGVEYGSASKKASPADKRDAQLISQVVALCKRQNATAMAKLNKLASMVSASRRMTAAEQKAHRKDLAAIQDRLHVRPGDANYLSVLQRARAELAANAGVLSASPVARDNPGRCSASDWGCTTERSRIWLTPKWFATSQQCKADVIAHEFSHVRGRAHQWEVTGKQDHKLFSSDEALIDPNEMAQLVGLLSMGSADHCR